MTIIQVFAGRIVNREEVVKTLVVEGGIQFNVEKIEDITDEALLSACVQVIDTLAETKEKLFADILAETELTKQFYAACRQINVTVSRDEHNRIKLTRV